jgi:serine/threonine protein kinase
LSVLPQNFGHYRVLEEVGAGGLGRVFRGIDRRTGQTVAIKLLHDRFSSSRKFLGIFHRELLIISRLNHKHIVSYLDSGFEPPNCFIVTEFVEGWSLYALMKKVKKFPPLVALSIIMDVLQGIDYLHLHDTIHSDLSSPNILVDCNGRVLVTDFGLACHQQVEDYKNYMVGTPGYYSPEHITESSIMPQTDLYCAGLILYEMLTGFKAAPPNSERREILKAMKNINFKAIICSDRKMQKWLRKLLQISLTYNVSRRTKSTEQMMYMVFSILKGFRIRYTRHALLKFLHDGNLVPGRFEGNEQDIYLGMIR